MQFLKLSSIFSILLMAICSTNASAAIFKVTTADGNIIYSDYPENYENSHTELVINEPTSISAVRNNTVPYDDAIDAIDATEINSQQKALQESLAPIYSETINYNIEFISPNEPTAFHKPAQSVDVNLAVSPALQNSAEVVIFVDDQQVATGTRANILLEGIEPGEHTLTAKVITANGDVKQTKSMLFYVIQNTHVIQRQKQVERMLADYNALPWYKKVSLKMKGIDAESIANTDITPKVSSSF